MPTTLPIELFYFMGAGLLSLTGLTWRNLNARVSDIEAHHKTMPLGSLRVDMAEIKRDVEWIKNHILKSR